MERKGEENVRRIGPGFFGIIVRGNFLDFDLRYYWVRDRILHNEFQLFWRQGKSNMADYFTKHYPPFNHKLMRYICTNLFYFVRLVYEVVWSVTSTPSVPLGPHFNYRRHVEIQVSLTALPLVSLPPTSITMYTVLQGH